MPSIDDLAGALLARTPPRGPLIVGLTGAVASGKSTLAGQLAETLAGPPTARRVEIAGTDGFLHPNARLIEMGILDRKGFPESYDIKSMTQALRTVRAGPAQFPGYSHHSYDIAPELARTIEAPDVLIVEGLGLDRRSAVDTLVYLQAEEADLETWFVRRFLAFWRQGQSDPNSFYARFAGLDEAGASALAARVWGEINLPNLRRHIAPIREEADLVVVKGPDHRILEIVARSPPL